MQLSVVIPTFNRATVLERCLSALGAQSAPASTFEIIVVNDGSADNTQQVVERAADTLLSPVRYLRQANAGPAAARNRGLALAHGDTVLFLGDDAIADRNLIQAHIEAQAAGPVACVGLIVPDEAHTLSPFERFLEASGLQFDYSPIHRDANDLPFSMFYTANVAAPRSALVAVGGFDERFRDACWEDVEIGYRLARAGVRFRFAPKARVLHAHPMTLQQYMRRMEKAGCAARLLVSLHPQEEMASIVAPMLMSRLGYLLGGGRSHVAQILARVAETTGLAQRYPRLLYGSYAIALHYAFNRSFYGPAAALEV